MKTRTFLAAFALVFVAASCAKEVAEAPAKLSEMTFTAGIDTRTVLTASYGVEWVANNSISVFDGVGNQQFTTSDNGTSASFSGSADAGATEYYGLYPYSASASCSAGVISTSLPATQTAVKGSFADGVNVSVAHTTDHSFHFLNACALVAVNLQKYSDIVSIQLAGGANEDLAGDLSISFDSDGKPVTVISGNASKTVTLAPASGVLEEGVYYFVVAPNTYASGFVITLTDSQSRTVDITQDTSVALERAKLKAYTVRNPYWFYRCIWGNNLGLTPAKDYANQFHATTPTDLSSLGTLTSTLIDENGNTVTKVSAAGTMGTKVFNYGSIRSNANYYFGGVTTIADNRINSLGLMMVNVTNGGNNVGATSVNEPIFLSFLKSGDGTDEIPFSFKPFAVMANPVTGGTYDTGATTYGYSSSELLIDWRTSFNYYNANGSTPPIDGEPATENSYLYYMWQQYYDSVGKALNTGARAPVSYIDNATNPAAAQMYINPGDYKIIVNPGKWSYNGTYANGVFKGAVSYVTTGDSGDVADGDRVTPLWVWFDEKF